MGDPIIIDSSSSDCSISSSILESDPEDDAEVAASLNAPSINAGSQGNGGNTSKRVAHNNSDFRSSSHTGLSGSEYQNHSAVQSERRVLPSSFNSSSSHTKPNSVRDVERYSQIRENGKSYLPSGRSLLNGKEDFATRMHGDMMDKSGNRVLPPWMRPSSSFTDPLDAFRTSDEKMAGPDERSVFQAVVQDLNQPTQEAELPEDLLSVPLLRHQKIALAWMRQKEARPFCVGGILADDQGLGKTISVIALIQMHKFSEQKSKIEDEHIHKTQALNLDEDDDNEAIDLDDAKLTEDSSNNKLIIKESSSCQALQKQRAAAGTLVVCPATVLRQWARELNDKVTKKAELKVLTYHGSGRTKDPSVLASYDVVLTTYAIVANEVPKQPLVDVDDAEQKGGERYGSAETYLDKKRKFPSSSRKKGKKGRKCTDDCFSDGGYGALGRVSWLRVVLDEAQTIKNHRTQVARACWGLRAKRRWCLSGTPIQNTVDELFSYFRFLKYDPYSSYRAFCEGIKGPISRDSQYGYQKLQAVLRTVMLRRTKGTSINGVPIITLPPKTVNIKSVDFTEEERQFYAKLEAESRSEFKKYARAGTLGQNYANILLMVLRLRQACDHPLLVCGYGSASARKVSSTQTLRKPPKTVLMNLLNRFEGSLICQLCKDPPEDAVVSICGHVFCYQCVLNHLDGDDTTCPGSECKEQLGTEVVFSEANIKNWLSDGSESCPSKGDRRGGSSLVFSDEYVSSKIKAAIGILKSLAKSSTSYMNLESTSDYNDDSAVQLRTEIIHPVPSDGPQKAIVFSQWTRMLDLMETSLKRSRFRYRRLDGTMSLAARDRAVREFSSDPQVTVMLMSLKAGNLGLNMVAACHVILLDLWWNPTTEDQAIDRAHRIGQTRPVTVSRLTIKDTVEDRILALQEEKRKMVASAFGENGGVSASRLSVHDLKFLFTGVR